MWMAANFAAFSMAGKFGPNLPSGAVWAMKMMVGWGELICKLRDEAMQAKSLPMAPAHQDVPTRFE